MTHSHEVGLIGMPEVTRTASQAMAKRHGCVLAISATTEAITLQVDHLKRRLRRVADPPQVHNLAFPGATAQDDLADQVSRLLALFPKAAPPQASPRLDPDGTTYCE